MNVKKDERNNIIYGAEYIPENSKVNFVGTGNILYLESGVYLENAILNFMEVIQLFIFEEGIIS